MRRHLHRGLVTGAAVACLFLVALAQRDDRGSRRRGDLMPIELSRGARVEFRSFSSDSLSEERAYSVFLPPSYSKGTQTFPVLYFLHGLNNDHTSWTMERYGNLHVRIESMMTEKQIPEFLLVCPQGDNSFYTNQINGGKRYEDFVTQDLVRHMETSYRVRADRKNRAIAGTSMGGYGALKAAFKRPDLYAATVGHSPIVFLGRNPLDVPEEAKRSRMYQYFSQMLAGIFGDPIDQAYWDQNNLLVLGRSDRIKNLKIWFDYGTADRYNESIRLGEGLKALTRVLNESDIDHVFHEYPGEPHGWELVSNHFLESMAFLSQTFDTP